MSSSKIIEIPASSAKAFEVRRGTRLKIIDVEGQQVGDFVVFTLPDLEERLSTGRTRIENGTLRVTTGARLLSNLCNNLFTITEDTCGVHDLLYPPCCRSVFENRYKISPHDGCLENLTRALRDRGLTLQMIPDPFNVFMNTTVEENFKPTILPPASKAGDYVVLRAEADVLVGLSACAVDVGNTNAGKCKPLRIEIISAGS